MALASTSFVTLAALHGWCKVTPGVLHTLTSLTSTGGVATATKANHMVSPLDSVVVAGANEAAYNGTHVATILDADRFTFPVSGGPASPATGTITARASQDAALTQIGDRVCAEIERITGKYFAPRAAVTETHHGTGGRSILLRKVPVSAFTSLTVEDALIDSTLYAVDLERGVVTLKGGTFGRAVGSIVAVYDAGSALADIPYDLLHAAEELAKFFYDRWSANALVASSLSVGPSNITVLPGVPRDIEQSIARHRDTRFG